MTASSAVIGVPRPAARYAAVTAALRIAPGELVVPTQRVQVEIGRARGTGQALAPERCAQRRVREGEIDDEVQPAGERLVDDDVDAAAAEAVAEICARPGSTWSRSS
jgi:hypothetical protein